MSDESPIAKTLNEILTTQSFEQLGNYTEQEVWQTFAPDERLLLARLFVMSAESDLVRATSEDNLHQAKKTFSIASTIAPNDAYIWYRRGLVFGSQEAKHLLEEGSVCLAKAVSIDETFFDAWYSWANVLVRRGIATGDVNYFIQAEEKFKKAESLLNPNNIPIEFYWQFGLAYFMMGRHSGEAGDTHKAISCYRKAKELGLHRERFYNDFANALVELSLLINSHDLLFEAIELYLYSLDGNDKSKDSPRDRSVRFCNLGACYQYLFEVHHDETYFKQAQEAFQEATQLQPEFSNAWAFWGYMLLYAAKLWQDISYLELALDKFSHLSSYVEDKPLLLSRMAEAFALYGGNEEDLKFLNNAQELAESATLEGPEVAYTWASLATAYLELGRYFGEEGYFRLAVENAERAIALNDKVGAAWHVLAVSKFALSDFDDEVTYIEEAIAAFNVASKTDVGRFGFLWNDWGIALLSLADVTHDKKHVHESIEKFEQAILLHDQVNPVWLVNYGSALDFWGDISDDESFYDKAIEVLQHALHLDPTNSHAKYHLGLALCHQGELTSDLAIISNGIDVLKQVLLDDPEDETCWADLAMAYMNIADCTQDDKAPLYALAEEHFLQAIALGNQQVFYSLACLYSLQENGPEAYDFLIKAFEADTMPPIEDIMQDRWLEYLRSTAHFQQFLKNLT